MRRALSLAAMLWACSDDGGGRWLLLEQDEVRGMDRICLYSDALGARAVTVKSWEACEPFLEVAE